MVLKLLFSVCIFKFHISFVCYRRVTELMHEVIDKYGVTWVAAAGNHGPCLSTIGTPPDTSTDLIIGQFMKMICFFSPNLDS